MAELQRWVGLLFLVITILCSSFTQAIAQSLDEKSGSATESKTETDNSLEGFGEDSLEGFGDDSLDGFGDENDDMGSGDFEIDLGDIQADIEKPSDLIFGGFIKLDLGYSPAHKEAKFSKIRTILNFGVDYKFNKDWRFKGNWNGFYDYAAQQQYRLSAWLRKGQDQFTEETFERDESEAEIRDFYIDGVFTDFFQIKLGRQIIAWGESEATQIIDMANPRDLREIGMVDLEDARVPVTASRFSFLTGQWELNLVAIHEIRSNKIPLEGSEFDVFQELRKTGIQLEDEEVPGSNAKNTEYLIRLFKTFNGGDISFVWADTYDDAPRLDFYSFDTSSKTLTLIPRHQRIKTAGFSANLVSGSWLFKTEMARKTGVAIARNDQHSQLTASLQTIIPPPSNGIYTEEQALLQGWSAKDVNQGVLGVEYSGVSDLTLGVEASGQKINEYEENLASIEIGTTYSLRATYAALNDTLKSTLFWVKFPKNNGDVVRINVDYDFGEALTASFGAIDYISDEETATVYPYRDNDRLLLGFKKSF